MLESGICSWNGSLPGQLAQTGNRETCGVCWKHKALFCVGGEYTVRNNCATTRRPYKSTHKLSSKLD
jgi:hypothetical protein